MFKGGNWLESDFNYNRLIGLLNSIQIEVGFKYLHSGSAHVTCKIVKELYNWWNKPWENHGSLYTWNPTAAAEHIIFGSDLSITAKMAAQIPGVGRKKAVEIGKMFSSPMQLVLAAEEELMEIKGIGKGLAKRIINSLNGEVK
jgi:ERCC4-type nuclease